MWRSCCGVSSSAVGSSGVEVSVLKLPQAVRLGLSPFAKGDGVVFWPKSEPGGEEEGLEPM